MVVLIKGMGGQLDRSRQWIDFLALSHCKGVGLWPGMGRVTESLIEFEAIVQ